MPFQHPGVSKLIYAFWFSGSSGGYAELRAPRDKFSAMPDNLIALVCNAVSPSWSGSVGVYSLLHHKQLEAALKDHLQASAGNALDLQFSNKIYAPK